MSHHIPGVSYWKLSKILTTEKILSLRITSSFDGVEGFLKGKLYTFIDWLKNRLRWIKYDIPSAGKIRNHTLQEVQELGSVFLLFD